MIILSKLTQNPNSLISSTKDDVNRLSTENNSLLMYFGRAKVFLNIKGKRQFLRLDFKGTKQTLHRYQRP